MNGRIVMKRTGKYLVFTFFPLLLIVFAASSGCDRGSSSVRIDSNFSEDGSGFSETTDVGTVLVFVSDGPTAEFSNIFIHIAEITLIGNGAPVQIFSGDLEVDLLDLRDEDLLLAMDGNVPAGTYEKIRLEVHSIRGEGGPCSMIKLPSGRIDLNPRGGFEVVPGEAVSIRLDLDAPKSMNVHVAGNSGKCIFRPVVFVDIEPGFRQWRCPRIIRGTIFDFFEDETAYNGVWSGFTIELPDARGYLDIFFAGDTVVFDNAMNAVDSTSLSLNDEVRIRGNMTETGAINASMAVMGELAKIKGTADTPVDDDGRFVMIPDAGEEVFDAADVSISQETIITAGCDQRVGSDAICAGCRVKVFGKIDLQNGVIKAALVVVNPAEITGEIVAVDDAAQLPGKLVTVEPEEGADDVTVYFPPEVPLYLQSDGSVSEEFLAVGRQVRIELDASEGPGLHAEQVFFIPERLEGALEGIDQLVIDGTVIEVMPGATILDVTDDEHIPALVGDIYESGYVKCFGLPAGPGDIIDFYAFVVLITEVPDVE